MLIIKVKKFYLNNIDTRLAKSNSVRFPITLSKCNSNIDNNNERDSNKAVFV
jgi:hypothetical protein